MEIMAIIWLVLMVLFMALEAATVMLASIWFAAGSLCALIVCLLGGRLWLQIVVFFVVSILLLILLLPMAKKRLKSKVVATNADALVGKVCKVTEAIDPMDGGRIKVGDVTWSAHSPREETIPVGARVKILQIQGTKVIVEAVNQEVEV